MKYFSTNLSGRVRNFSLPKNRPLIPLYEAIVNSINAIEERYRNDSSFNSGKIRIEVLRQRTLFDEADTTTVDGFIITDNGIGFTEANMQSFMESDSAYKAEIGGKGVGRFAWLKAFSKVAISSIYSEDGVYQKREFQFCIDKSGIDDQLEECSNVADNKTVVTLSSYLKDYERYVPKQIDTIAMRIVQHCLVYFIGEKCPDIVIFDSKDSLSLNAIFREKFKTENNVSHISVEGKDFELLNVKIEDRAFNNGNRLYLCANGRLVDSIDLEGYIIDLDRQIFERNGFWYLGVMTSRYFDNNVDMNRLSFSIPETSGPLYADISMEQIIKEACEEVRLYLAEYLAKIKAEKEKRITEFTTDKAPQYRHLLHYMASDIEAIKPGLTDEKLDDELFSLKRKFENETKAECNGLIQKLKNGTITSDEYQSVFEKEIKKISDANRAALTDYILHRRIIINLFENGLHIQDDGKFNKEKYMHDLIYPMRTSSDLIDYESHNLWLIDETLSYCQYITSDIPFDNNPAEERVDVLFLDRPVAVAEESNDGTIYDAITIFELKRPMRDEYTDDNNPMTQLYEYVQKIKAGKAKDIKHRPIRTGETTKFYLYAICDITPTLEHFLDQRGFIPTPDNMGRYQYNDRLHSYFEILSYNKVLNEAKKRNRILFDKLGL